MMLYFLLGYDAFQRVLITGMNPYDLHLLPDSVIYRYVIVLCAWSMWS